MENEQQDPVIPANYIQLHGSERRPSKNAQRLGAADDNETFKVTIALRRRTDGEPMPDFDQFKNKPLQQRKPITDEAFALKYGAHPDDIAEVVAFANSNNLSVLETHAGRRTVVVSGTVAQMNKAFGISLGQYQHEVTRSKAHGPHTEIYRGREGFIHIPIKLKNIIVGVFGLDNRSITKRNNADPPGTAPLTVAQITGLYNFPTNSAAGQTIGVASPGGSTTGYFQSDLQSFFGASLPTITPISADGTSNNGSINITTSSATSTGSSVLHFASTAGIVKFSNVNQSAAIPGGTFVTAVTATTITLSNPVTATIPSGTAIIFNLDFETTQDICISASAAPGANVNVYFSTNDQAGWNSLISRIIHPNAGDNVCSVLTCSFYISDGDDDGTLTNEGVTGGLLDAVSGYFNDAAVKNITVCIASGDTGSSSKVGGNPAAWGYTFAADNKAHVQFPGSSPWVLAVGGTTIGNLHAGTFDEYVWNDPAAGDPSNWGTTGGGVSDRFALPSYQTGAGVPKSVNDNTHVGRGVPDVAANASLNSGYANIVVGGGFFTGNGTSGSAPLWAGLITTINAAIGSPVGFVNTNIYDLGSAFFNDIVPGSGPANNGNSGITGYTAGVGWDACTGWGSPDGVKLLNGLISKTVPQTLEFWVDKNTFGKDEVTDIIASPTSNGVVQNAFWLVVEGFNLNALGSATPSLSGDFNNLTASGITITPGTAGVQYQLGIGNQFTPQRVRFPFDITFTSTDAFPATNPAQELLSGAITIQGQPLNAETVFELTAGADPYFTNVDASNGSSVFWLSQDLRVFTVTAGQSPVSGAAAFTSDPYASIQGFLGYLNSTPAFTVISPADPLNTLPGQTGYETGDTSVSPLDSSNNQNYNFAIARVRLRGSSGVAGQAENVRVFFRLFVATSCDTDYQPLTTYKSDPDAAGFPGSPLASGSGAVDPQGNSIQNIPFFATNSTGTNDYNSTVTNGNIRTIIIPDLSDSTWAYFGCYLDVYNSSNNSKFPGTHHCIVAQIAYDNAPIFNPPGVTVSPENSDKLAQRNLQITSSGNPGPAATHRIPQTFDLRASKAFKNDDGSLFSVPDELMIDWGHTPVSSNVSIYLPQVNAEDIINLADELYGPHLLSVYDAYTIQLKSTKGVTYIPIPAAPGQNFAGLFTIDLPIGVANGQEFNIIVRRVAARQTATKGVGVRGNSESQGFVNWRYITGTFQIKIPVTTEALMLPAEENTLAILKWRLQQMSPLYRWYPVLQRYIEYISGRVDGAGGNSGAIQPSPTGTGVIVVTKPPCDKEERDCGCTELKTRCLVWLVLAAIAWLAFWAFAIHFEMYFAAGHLTALGFVKFVILILLNLVVTLFFTKKALENCAAVKK